MNGNNWNINENTPSRICFENLLDLSTFGNTGVGSTDIALLAGHEHYILYSEEDVRTRFTGTTFDPGNTDNFVAVVLETATGDWYTLSNGQLIGQRVAFTPISTDRLVTQIISAGTSQNFTSDGQVAGILSVADAGGLTIQDNTYNGVANPGEFDLSGQFKTGQTDFALLQLDGTYIKDSDGSVLEVDDAITEGWFACEHEHTCFLPTGDIQALTANSGTLTNGTTYTIVNNDGGAITHGTTDGDIRWETGDELELTFSKEVTLFLKPTVNAAPINNPIVWSRGATALPNVILQGPFTFATGNGDIVEYTPGTVPATLKIVDDSTEDTTGQNFKRGLGYTAQADVVNAGAPNASQDWGVVTLPKGTVFRVGGRDAEAMNFSVQELEERDHCEVLEELLLKQDESGTVLTATAALTTTNGVDVAIGEYYTEFPDGTTWASNASGWTLGGITTDTNFTASNRVSYVYASIPDTTNEIDVSNLNNGDEIEIRIHPQDNIGTATLSVAGGNIISEVEGGTNGVNASVTYNQGDVVRFRMVNGNLWTINRYPESEFEHPDAGYAYCNTTAEQSNGAGNNVGPTTTTFIPHADGDYIFDYSGEVVSGTGGISIGTTAGGSEIFVSAPATGDADGARLSVTRQENFTPALTLQGGVTYYITQWAGGGGEVLNHTVCGTTVELREYIQYTKDIDLYTKNIECYEGPEGPVNTILENPNTNEVGTTLAANGISWDTIAVGQTFDSVTVLIRNNGAALTGVSYDIEDFDGIITVPTDPLDIPTGDSYVTFTFPEITVTAAIHANGELNLGGNGNTFPNDFVIPHTGNGNYGPFFNANNNESWIGSVGNGGVVTPEYSVVTLSDDTQVVYDSNGDEVTVDISTLTPCAEEPLICTATGTTSVYESVTNIGPTNGLPGTIVAPAANITLSGALNVPTITPIQFHGLDGEILDAELEVTRLGNGGSLIMTTNGRFSNQPGAGDYSVKVSLPDGLSYRFGADAGSAGVGEPFVFLANNPVVEYAQGAGGIGLTLPYVGAWNNNNGNVTSGFGFDASNTFEMRTNGQAGVSSSFAIYLMDVPTYPEQEICERTAAMTDDINELKDLNVLPSTTVPTGLFVLSKHEDPQAIPGTIITGHDLTQAQGMTLEVVVRDQASNRSWDTLQIDVDNMLERFAAGDIVDAWVTQFDNDYVTINVVNPATGELTFGENGRDFEYRSSQLISPLQALESIVNANVTAGQNINDNDVLEIDTPNLIQGAFTFDNALDEFTLTSDAQYVKIFAQVNQSIPQAANSQRPAPALNLQKFDGTNWITIATSATGYIRDFADHEESSNTIIHRDIAPVAGDRYRFGTEQESNAAVVNVVIGTVDLEAKL